MEQAQLLIPGHRHIKDSNLIIRLESDGNYSIFYLDNKEKRILVSETLKYFERQLVDFIRVNKSALINPKYIEKLCRVNPKQLYIVMKDGSQIIVSRRRVDEVKKLINGQ